MPDPRSEARADRARELLAEHGIECLNGSMAYRGDVLPGDAIIAAMLAFAQPAAAMPSKEMPAQILADADSLLTFAKDDEPWGNLHGTDIAEVKASIQRLAQHVLTPSHSGETGEVELTRRFNAGYLIAVANIMNLHGEEVIAKDVLQQLGVKVSVLKGMDLTDYDLKPLRKLFRNIASYARFEAGMRKRPALKTSPGDGGLS